MRDITKMTYKRMEDEARQSVRRDFQKRDKVIYYIDPESSYYSYRSKVLGRPIEVVRNIGQMIVIRFKNDSDRKALNEYAGWSDNKTEYLIDKSKIR